MDSETSALLNHPINLSGIYIRRLQYLHVYCLSSSFPSRSLFLTMLPDWRERIFINASFEQVQIVQGSKDLIKSHSPEFNAHLEPPCYHTPTTEHWI